MKKLVVVACILVCVIFAVSCPTDDSGSAFIPVGKVFDWNWEVGDDSNPGRFAPGVSTLDPSCYTADAAKNAQTYAVNTPYVSGQPNTGRYVIDDTYDPPRVSMVDSYGYDSALSWPANKGAGAVMKAKTPKLQTTIGPDGTEVQAYRIKGVCRQAGSNSADAATHTARNATNYKEGAGWPGVNWAAVPPDLAEQPDQETRFGLMDGYGYTFWVKSNVDYLLYRTSVENYAYRMLEGTEPAHWFGTDKQGFAENKNFTAAPVNQWRQIKVVYDPMHPDFNMIVPLWLITYDIQSNYPNDPEPKALAEPGTHDKQKSIKIGFSIQLQNNGGVEGEEDVEYSIVSGYHEFDIWFYDLRILMR